MNKKYLFLVSLLLLSGCSLNSLEQNDETSTEESTQASTEESAQASSELVEFYEGDLINEVNINLATEDYEAMLDAPLEEEYYEADISLGDETIESVGFRTKGNSSLSSVASSDSDRYSFKINLGTYVDDQVSEADADEFVLNNMFGDPSFMREYISYQVLAAAGVEVPYSSYAKVTINDEYQGVYLLVESVDDSFLTEHFGDDSGILYKADEQSSLESNDTNTYETLELKSGDDDNYEALNNLVSVINDPESTTEDISSVLDIDSALAYIAFNTVFASYDSYNGEKAHNYYLYQLDGIFYVIPWDYNMSFNGYPAPTATENVTEVDIYEPVYGVEMSERPLISTLLSNDDFQATYLEYIDLFNENLLNMDTIVSELDTQIGDLVANDPTKFYTTEDYETSITFDETYDFTAETTSDSSGQMMRQAPGQMMSPDDGLIDPTTTDSQMTAQTPSGQAMQSSQSGGVDTQMGTTPLLNYAKVRSDFITNQLSE